MLAAAGGSSVWRRLAAAAAGAADSSLDRLALVFDDERAVANAGLVLASTLAGRLGIERVVDETLILGRARGGGLARAQAADARLLGASWAVIRSRTPMFALRSRRSVCSAIG